METDPRFHEPRRTWPPADGWPLFLAWMGAIVCVPLARSAITMAIMPGMRSHPRSVLALFMLPLVAARGWQAWLLFRRHPIRFGLWTALPLTLLVLPITHEMIQSTALAMPLMQAALLRGVRQRAWAWLLAGMVSVVLLQIPIYFHPNPARVRHISETLGLGVFANFLAKIDLWRGLWMLGETISAAVLAWKMPAVKANGAGRVVEVEV